MTEGGDVDVVFLRHFQNGLAGPRADFLAVNEQRFYVHTCAHANTSKADSAATGASMLHTPAGQRLCTMWSMYSCLKYFSVLSTGFGAVCPRPHRLVSFTVAHRSTSRSRSSMVPWPLQMRVRRSEERRVGKEGRSRW